MDKQAHEELRECPCCNSKVVISSDTGNDDEYYVEFIECYNCGLRSKESRRITDEIIKAWNTRAKLSARIPTEEEIKYAIDNLEELKHCADINESKVIARAIRKLCEEVNK